jgi:hypothetical protein
MTVKICLNMIVKNESAIIRSCLDNVKHLIDAAVIEDTGSTDDTIDLIDSWLVDNNLPGKIVSEEWSDFGTNRSSALSHAEWFLSQYQEDTWYILFMDADNKAVGQDGISILSFDKSKLTHDAYKVSMKSTDLNYTYDYLWMIKVQPNRKWKWFEVCHEYLGAVGWNPTFGRIKDGYIISGRHGARNKDPMKYQKDALLFETVLKNAPAPSDTKADSIWCRRRFYCAQSWRDAGLWDLAEKRYQECLDTVNGWTEERYIAGMRLFEQRYRGRVVDQKGIDLLFFLFTLSPDRLEAPYHLVQQWRLLKKSAAAYRFGRGFLDAEDNLSKPTGLFIVDSVYEWAFYEELALVAWDVKDKDLFSRLIRKQAQCQNIKDPAAVKRLQNNLQFA